MRQLLVAVTESLFVDLPVQFLFSFQKRHLVRICMRYGCKAQIVKQYRAVDAEAFATLKTISKLIHQPEQILPVMRIHIQADAYTNAFSQQVVNIVQYPQIRIFLGQHITLYAVVNIVRAIQSDLNLPQGPHIHSLSDHLFSKEVSVGDHIRLEINALGFQFLTNPLDDPGTHQRFTAKPVNGNFLATMMFLDELYDFIGCFWCHVFMGRIILKAIEASCITVGGGQDGITHNLIHRIG